MARLTPLLQIAQIRDSKQAEPLIAARGAITFENIGVKIGENWLLRDISLTIPAGQSIALVGPDRRREDSAGQSDRPRDRSDRGDVC